MRAASEREEFELAAKLRDQLAAARRALESQEMVLPSPEDLDVLGLAEDDIEAAFQVFFVRRGRVTGRKGWVADRVEDLDRAGLVGSFLRQLYMERQDVPPRVLVPSAARGRGCPPRVALGTAGRAGPVRGPGARHQTQAHGGRHAERARAFSAPQAPPRVGFRCAVTSALGARRRVLELEEPPLRIECYDMSNLGTTDTVGSMVVFEDGLPKRSDYRRFEIKGVPGQDDFASMEEMLRRRFARLSREHDTKERRRRSRTRPRSSSSTAAGGSSASRRRRSRTPACTSRRSAWRSGSRRSTSPTDPIRC